jgi:hypothetical protein
VSRAERITTFGDLADEARPVSLANEQTVPLTPSLARLVPVTGLGRGTTVAVTSGTSQGATTLAFALASAASAHGAWCAAVGFPDLGLVAISELGLALERLALVPHVPPSQWAAVVGALVDAVDILIIDAPARLSPANARRLVNRARERGTVLIPVGRWPERADLRLVVAGAVWEGTGAGDGHLVRRRLDVQVSGRGAASGERHVELGDVG